MGLLITDVKRCLPVRHPHDHTLHATLTGDIDDGLEGGDEHFTALQTESFLWRPLPLEELLKPVNRWWCCCLTLWLRSWPPTPPQSKKNSLQLLWMLIQLTEVCWGTNNWPCGSNHSGQKSPLLLQTELHDSWCLKPLSDPLALLHVINEHELNTDMLTVGHLREKGGCLMSKYDS